MRFSRILLLTEHEDGSCAAGTSASKALIEGLNRVVGDSLSAQVWFAPKETQEEPIRLPWQACTAKEHGYERSAFRCVFQCMAVKVSDSSVCGSFVMGVTACLAVPFVHQASLALRSYHSSSAYAAGS